MSKVLITGAEGFIGKNLLFHLKQLEDIEILTFDLAIPKKNYLTRFPATSERTLDN